MVPVEYNPSASIPPYIKKIFFLDRTGKAREYLIKAQNGIYGKLHYPSDTLHFTPDFKNSKQELLEWKKVAELLHNDTTSLLATIESYVSGFIPPGNSTRTYKVYKWRTYDLRSKTIIDEYEMDTQFHTDYSDHFIPQTFYDKREYYIRGGKKMKEATRMIRYEHGDQADKIWREMSRDSTSKAGARACFNLGFTAEMRGKIDSAIYWVSKAKRMGNKKAKNYLKELELEKTGRISVLNGLRQN